jgi:hypothetical protein
VPRTSLGTFVAAAFACDLLWPVFLLLGVERVRIQPGATRFTPLALDYYPWSHSLVMTTVWGALGAALGRVRGWDRRTQVLVALTVLSHWVLDVVSHRPDVPLWPGRSPLLGLGLWNSIPATYVVEGGLFLGGIVLYVRATRAADRIGSIGFWLFVGLSGFMWAGTPWTEPPPTPRALALFGLGAWMFPIWAGWADRHRIPWEAV